MVAVRYNRPLNKHGICVRVQLPRLWRKTRNGARSLAATVFVGKHPRHRWPGQIAEKLLKQGDPASSFIHDRRAEEGLPGEIGPGEDHDIETVRLAGLVHE